MRLIDLYKNVGRQIFFLCEAVGLRMQMETYKCIIHQVGSWLSIKNKFMQMRHFLAKQVAAIKLLAFFHLSRAKEMRIGLSNYSRL